jgi:hypothetical protein
MLEEWALLLIVELWAKKVSEALLLPLVEIPDNEPVESLHVCPMFAAVRTKNSLYWWGINPFNERRRVFDKHKNKAKKFISTSSSDIKIGAEVRTKSNPVYAANSVAVNLQSSIPMIGVMMESAWSLTETCRFRIYTPEQFDQLKDDSKPKEDKKAMNCKFLFEFLFTFSNKDCWFNSFYGTVFRVS